MTDLPLTSPGPGARRRGGRRPGSSPSRQKILEVARLAFPANGYAETSLRGIARDAGRGPVTDRPALRVEGGVVRSRRRVALRRERGCRPDPRGPRIAGRRLHRTQVHQPLGPRRAPQPDRVPDLRRPRRPGRGRGLPRVHHGQPHAAGGRAGRGRPTPAPCGAACLAAHWVRAVPLRPWLRRACLGPERGAHRRARRHAAEHLHESAQRGDPESRSARQGSAALPGGPA